MKLISVLPKFLNELEFSSQDSFSAYKKKHPQMRASTKVKIAGKDTTVGDASKNEPGILKKLGSKLFGKSKVEMPKLKTDHPLNKMKVYDTKSKKQVSIEKIMDEPDKYKHLAADVQSMIDLDPKGKKALNAIEKAKQKRREKEKERSAYNKKAAADRERALKNPKKPKSSRSKSGGYSSYDIGGGFGGGSSSGGSFGGSSGGFGGFGGGGFGGAGAGGSW